MYCSNTSPSTQHWLGVLQLTSANNSELAQPPQVRAQSLKTAPPQTPTTSKASGLPSHLSPSARPRSNNLLEQLTELRNVLSLHHQFIIKDTTQEQPDGGDAQGRAGGPLGAHPPSTSHVHQPTSPQAPLPRDFYRGSAIQVGSIKPLATGDPSRSPLSQLPPLKVLTLILGLVFLAD